MCRLNLLFLDLRSLPGGPHVPAQPSLSRLCCGMLLSPSFFRVLPLELPLVSLKAAILLLLFVFVCLFVLTRRKLECPSSCLLVILSHSLLFLFPRYWKGFGFICQLLFWKPQVHSISVYLPSSMLQEHKCLLFCLLKFKF